MEMKPLLEFLAAQQKVEETKPQVGSLLRALRRDAGLTQDAVAARADVNQAYLSQIENGQKTPSASSLQRIIGVLDPAGAFGAFGPTGTVGTAGATGATGGAHASEDSSRQEEDEEDDD